MNLIMMTFCKYIKIIRCQPQTGRGVEEGSRGVDAVTLAPAPPVAGAGGSEVVVGVFKKDPYS